MTRLVRFVAPLAVVAIVSTLHAAATITVGTPVTLLTVSGSYADFGFPTLVSVDLDDCHAGPCNDRDQALGNHASQQITGASGYLYYSARPSSPPGARYHGHRVRFDISD